MNVEKFCKFAKFYGLETITVSCEMLFSIYQDVSKDNTISIYEYTEKYHLSIHEFVICIVYFEYCYLIGAKNISVEEGMIRPLDYTDQGLLLRYGVFFTNKNSYAQILEQLGNQAIHDLEYFNERFLIPGVRILNSNIYYVGDIDDEK